MRRIHFLVPTAFLCTAALACGPGGASGDDDDDDDDVQIDAGFDTDGTPASEECRKMDLIFVIDDSGSMEQEQTNLASNFPAFANLLNAYTISTGETLDYRAAITTTGITADITIQPPVVPGFPPFPPIPSPQTGLDGKFRQACGMTRPWLERTDPNMASTFACAADVGTNGPAIEMPLRASQLAAMAATNPGFLRSDALLGVIILTDEDDCSRTATTFTTAGDNCATNGDTGLADAARGRRGPRSDQGRSRPLGRGRHRRPDLVHVELRRGRGGHPAQAVPAGRRDQRRLRRHLQRQPRPRAAAGARDLHSRVRELPADRPPAAGVAPRRVDAQLK
jgi:hypothetical protein